MRPLVLLAAIGAVVCACGSTAAAHTPIVFGVSGGNMLPYRVSIQPNGTVRARGSVKLRHRQLPAATVRRLRREVQQAGLSSRRCAGVLPDVGEQFIRVGGRTWTVHGACEKRFERVWQKLTDAVGLGIG
ncbi:MAG TPA: hypothetical protein VE088_06075 [Gaiellaceae bacterium]|nr:hypothetical protein [Gaiellaceae bacterium]